jgi:Na+:H+ antiporter, NhaA family
MGSPLAERAGLEGAQAIARASVIRPPRIDRMVAPLREFINSTVSGGLLLIAAAGVALVWANSEYADSYFGLWHSPLSIGIGDMVLTNELEVWINDGLMAIFFLLVGLEIKRELLIGELASLRRAALPVAAAAGGAILPAIIFLTIAGGSGDAARGWGVPMATDIAFALGVLALLGSRIPLGLRIFVAALAIVDDLLAVLVIAVFYTAELNLVALAAAGAVFGGLLLANWLGVSRPLVYALLGILMWAAILQSGVHATVAGVLLALTIPARRRLDPQTFLARARQALNEFERRVRREGGVDHGGALSRLEMLTKAAEAPMARMEHALQSWVAFVIVPLFALANAGVTIVGDLGALVVEPVVIGIVAGLVIGKQLGITIAAWLVVRLGWASLPAGVSWPQVYGVGWLAGIGFTMSLLIAALAYGPSPALDLAKLAIVGASVIAGLAGFVILRLVSPHPARRSAVAPAAETG